jgi:hypothetical protein
VDEDSQTAARHVRDEVVIGAALRGAVDGPFFPEWEFRTLMGVTRDEMRRVLADWPHRSDPTANLAVNNALVNIWTYPHHAWDAWDAWALFSDATPEEIHGVLQRWKSGANPDFGE